MGKTLDNLPDRSQGDTASGGAGAGGPGWVSPVIKAFFILVLLVVAGGVWFYLHRPAPSRPPVPVLPVETIRPIVGNIDRTITVNSFVGSDSVVTVLPKVSGTLTELDADVGTHLVAGQVVAKIDPGPYQIAVNQAKAVYDGAASVFDRQKQLFAGGATSRQNFDQAQTQYENAKSQYELAKLHLSYTTVLSPVDGTVAVRHVARGDQVSPSVPIVTLSNTHSLVVRAEVPESEARAFEAKRDTMPITASIPAMGSSIYRMRIRNIAPAIDVKTKTFSVECEIEGDTKHIMPGMFARVSFVLERRAGVAYLPFTALVGGNTLWYIAPDGTAQFLTFTPTYHNDDYFELSPQYSKYTFILAGQHFLSAGAPVEPVQSSR